MRKLLFIFLLLTLFNIISFNILSFNINNNIIFAETTSEEEVEEKLEESVEEQINNLDLSNIENVLNNLTEDEREIFGSGSFFEKLKLILSGKFTNDGKNIIQSIFSLLLNDIVTYLPLMAIIISIAILFSFIGNLKGSFKSSSIENIIHFACYGLIIILVMSSIMQTVKITSNTVNNIGKQMQGTFPILLTLLTAIGGKVSVSIYQPAFAIASSAIITIFSKILLPLFLFSLAFTIISNLSNTAKFDKFSSFFMSCFKWIIGFVFTLFFGFITIQGITAGKFDSISIRTAKYTIKNSVPLIGGYLSDGFNLIMASSILVKNAVGASALFLLMSFVLVPVIQIIIFSLCLKLTGAILEPVADNKIVSFLTSMSKSVTMLVVVILAVSFLYLQLIGLIMCTSNFV